MHVESPEKVANHLFRIVWQFLETVNLCDSYLGAEFQRVRREWHEAGCPIPVATFITSHANAGAGGDQ